MTSFLKAACRLLAIFLASAICFIIGKIIFIFANPACYGSLAINDFFSIVYHGLPMDFAMAGYVSVIPAIIQSVSVFTGTRSGIFTFQKWYLVLISAVISLVIILDAALYSYWQFKLDSTPLFYFMSSPAAAFASAEWWQLAAFPFIWAILGTIFFLLYRVAMKVAPDKRGLFGKEAVAPFFGMLILSALLFIPIRGGVTVSTMNLSRSYFSNDKRLNHAAVNPLFSLIYSLTHQTDFASQFRYFPEEEAEKTFSRFLQENETAVADSLFTPLLKTGRPDIFIIILESFSSHLFPSLGGEPVAVHLDSIAGTGLLFSNFYANSFRTDRGIPAILSAYPGQPTTSIMKFVEKTDHLPSIADRLKKEGGYTTEYYYGGDINFTNLNAYLVSGGFDRITSDVDFPISERLSKWGAHDEVVFRRVLEELKPYDSSRPSLTVIQTSSSHEPFEVPYDSGGRLSDKRANAFAYADSCAADFINRLKTTDRWENSIIIAVPDHYGAYPELQSAFDRHKIPLIMTGGALNRKGVDSTPGSQVDIAATLLSAMDISPESFRFSHNLLNTTSPHFGFFADPDVIGMVGKDGETLLNLDSGRKECGSDSLSDLAKTYLQVLYNDLSKR